MEKGKHGIPFDARKTPLEAKALKAGGIVLYNRQSLIGRGMRYNHPNSPRIGTIPGSSALPHKRRCIRLPDGESRPLHPGTGDKSKRKFWGLSFCGLQAGRWPRKSAGNQQKDWAVGISYEKTAVCLLTGCRFCLPDFCRLENGGEMQYNIATKW